MSAAPTELPVLFFFAGSLAVAVAARGVDVLAQSERELPHLAELLGVETDGYGDNERTVQMTHQGTSLRLRVDGPVRIQQLDVTQIVQAPAAMKHAGNIPVLGYAQHFRQLVALLDIPRLVEMAQRITTTKQK